VTEALDDLRARGRIQDVPRDPVAIERLLDDAHRHLATAVTALEEGDLAGAYQVAYDAARKSLTAFMLSRGVRARGLGAHAALIEATRALLADAEGVEALDPFDRMRQVRNEAEYAGHPFDRDEVQHDIVAASRIVDLAAAQIRRPS
jgi:uncharacterized protein (UPF0332 family)